MCTKSFVALRIKEALGILRELVTTTTRTTTRVAFRDAFGSKNYVNCFVFQTHCNINANVSLNLLIYYGVTLVVCI